MQCRVALLAGDVQPLLEPPFDFSQSEFANTSTQQWPWNPGAARVVMVAMDMLTISRSARLSKSPDGGVLLDVDRGVIFSLNSVGARIVELLQQGKEEMSVAEAVRREFQVSEDTARKDVADFLVTLREQLLLSDYREGGRSMESVPS
jgi:hypothetical protein